MTQKNRIFIKGLVREFSVFFWQAMLRGERAAFKMCYEEKSQVHEIFKNLSYAFCHGSNNTTISYVDIKMYDIFNQAIKAKMRNDPVFFSSVLEKLTNQVHAWEKVIKQKPTTASEAKKQLADVLKVLLKITPGIIYAFYLPTLSFIPKRVKHQAFKYRTEYDHFTHTNDRIIRRNLKLLFPKLGKLSAYLTMPEAIQNKLPSAKILSSRSREYFLYRNKITSDIDLEKFCHKQFITLKIEKDAITDIKTVRGLSASKNVQRTRGEVLLIFTRADLSKIKGKNKFVLVAPAITPEYTPYLKHAVAIITDEGGITSHAAIIARELGRSCIVGTKIATKVFKDGDFVEVDADKGKVNIVSRARNTNG